MTPKLGVLGLLTMIVSSIFEPRERPPATLHVPRATTELVLDGELEEPSWSAGAARTGIFVAPNGEPGRPHSEARFVWRGDTLYVALYAADRDIRASHAPADGPRWLDGDAFELTFSGEDGRVHITRIEISPDGTVTDAQRTTRGTWDYAWQSGARVGHDTDGTVNEPRDEDEEWVLEVAVPLSAIGVAAEAGARSVYDLRRCDWAPSGPRTCTSSTGVLELE